MWLRNTALQRTAAVRNVPIRTKPFSHVRESPQSEWLKPYNVAGSGEDCSNIAFLQRAPYGKFTKLNQQEHDNPRVSCKHRQARQTDCLIPLIIRVKSSNL